MRKAHLDFLAYVFNEDPPPFGECFGRTMVDKDYMPLGFALAWLRPEGATTIHAYYGHWLKQYPKDILRGMQPIMQRIREAGIYEVWAIADERVEGSRKLVEWFKGEPSGQIVENQGEYYKIDLRRSPI